MSAAQRSYDEIIDLFARGGGAIEAVQNAGRRIDAAAVVVADRPVILGVNLLSEVRVRDGGSGRVGLRDP
jgi:hypothetical protein